jgi:hypothetical protein
MSTSTFTVGKAYGWGGSSKTWGQTWLPSHPRPPDFPHPGPYPTLLQPSKISKVDDLFFIILKVLQFLKSHDVHLC